MTKTSKGRRLDLSIAERTVFPNAPGTSSSSHETWTVDHRHFVPAIFVGFRHLARCERETHVKPAGGWNPESLEDSEWFDLFGCILGRSLTLGPGMAWLWHLAAENVSMWDP